MPALPGRHNILGRGADGHEFGLRDNEIQAQVGFLGQAAPSLNMVPAGSRAVTQQPAAARLRASVPVPDPKSSTRWPASPTPNFCKRSNTSLGNPARCRL